MRALRGRIFKDAHVLAEHVRQEHQGKSIIMTSGGYAPAHGGHTSCIYESANLDPEAILVVVVNGNGWLERKKGFVVIDEFERAEVVSYISGVDYVLIWDDGTPTVCGAIEIIKPNIFTKGGDRDSSNNVPEYEVCQSIGCEVKFGIGNPKIQSSSNIIQNIVDFHKK